MIFNMPCQGARRTGNKKFADPERTLAQSLMVVVVVVVVMLNNNPLSCLCNITGRRMPGQLYYKVGQSLLNHQNQPVLSPVLIMTS